MAQLGISVSVLVVIASNWVSHMFTPRIKNILFPFPFLFNIHYMSILILAL